MLAGPTVPYKDSISGVVTGLVMTGPGMFTQTIAGTGQATHIGRVGVSGSHTLKFLTPQMGQVLNDSFTYIGPAGKTMTGTYSGTFTQVTPNSRRFDLTVSLQGGGKLAGVTGTAQTVVITMGQGGPGSTFTYTSAGTLTFP
jgi:hypothetical protein